MGNLTVSSEVDAFMQQTTLAGMFHAIVSFGTIDTTANTLTLLGSTLERVVSEFGPSELNLSVSLDNGNSLVLWNKSTLGFSALTLKDASGFESATFGWGNSGTGTFFSGCCYIEVSSLTGTPGPFMLCQDGDYGATGSGFRFYPRFTAVPDGDMTFWQSIPTSSTQISALKVMRTGNVMIGPYFAESWFANSAYGSLAVNSPSTGGTKALITVTANSVSTLFIGNNSGNGVIGVDGSNMIQIRSGMSGATDPLSTGNTVLEIGSGGLAVIGGGMGGGNALKLTASASTQFSAVCFIDAASGIEHGAIGWGNQTGGSLANESYWELSDLSSSTVNNGGRIVQTSTKKGYGWDPRIVIGADHAPIILYAYDSVTLADTSVTFSSVGIIGATPIDGMGFLVGIDGNTGTLYRSNLFGSSVNAVVYASFGDTAVNHGGHVFSTGGLIGAQTVKLVIANDFITTSIPFGSTVNIQDAAGGGFGQVGYDDNFNVLFRDGANANTHYCFGGTLGASAGHRFFTGGVKASQSLRMQIADDGINFLAPLFKSGVATNTLGVDTGWTANADGGDKTAVIPSNATLAAMATALNTLVPGFGDAFVATSKKMKAMEAALVALLTPNA